MPDITLASLEQTRFSGENGTITVDANAAVFEPGRNALAILARYEHHGIQTGSFFRFCQLVRAQAAGACARGSSSGLQSVVAR